MKINIKKVVISFVFIIFVTGNFTNAIIVGEENNEDRLYENISTTELYKESRNKKLGQSVENLLRNYTGKELEYFEKSLIRDFDFVDDKVRVEVILSDENDFDKIESFNEKIKVESHYENLVQILIPIDLIEQLSEEGFIRFIRKPIEPIPFDITSEGVDVIGADLIHSEGYNGSGVKVAIIDVGFTGYATNPELPSERIKEVKSFRSDGQINVSDHGTACAEIVLDVSPKADLHLYVISTTTEFCNAINYSVTQEVDIISLSIGYFNLNDLDGTGVACNAVDNARSAGTLVSTAAGNCAESHYCGWYVDSDDDTLHDFDTGNNFLILGYYPDGHPIDLYLSWNDWPYSDQDYDLILTDSYGNIIAYSGNVQSGSQPPVEEIGVYAPYDDVYLVFIFEYDASSSVRFQLFSSYQ